ncbi:MAG: hypothetical protein M1337_08930 [Actinobacteria bacterium]|nr:hypothetical protein [Actinomycetota bacterium]
MSDPLESAKLKLAWAAHDLELLETDSTAFYAQKPGPFAVDREVEGLYHVLRHRVVREPPLDLWSLIIGDVVHNARSALDHLAWQLAERHSPDRPQPDRLTMFPIFDDERVYRRLGARRLRWIEPRAAGIIEGLQPYKHADGSDLLLLLEELDVADKHKLLTTTTPFFQASDLRVTGPSGTEYPPVTAASAGTVEDGAELKRFIYPEEPDVKVQGHIEYQIGFADGLGRGKEVAAALHDVLVAVGDVLGVFEREVFHG